MTTMMQRAIAHMERDPSRSYTLNELRKAAGVALRSQYRLSQQLPCSGPPDMAGENQKQLRVPIERLGELYEGLGHGPLHLARLDPADLRSRKAAPPRQPPHRETRTQARLSRHLGHRLCLVLHRDQV